MIRLTKKQELFLSKIHPRASIWLNDILYIIYHLFRCELWIPFREIEAFAQYILKEKNIPARVFVRGKTDAFLEIEVNVLALDDIFIIKLLLEPTFGFEKSTSVPYLLLNVQNFTFLSQQEPGEENFSFNFSELASFLPPELAAFLEISQSSIKIYFHSIKIPSESRFIKTLFDILLKKLSESSITILPRSLLVRFGKSNTTNRK